MAVKGYAGKILRVNLGDGSLIYQDEDPGMLRKYLGGTGLGLRILFGEVPPSVEWSDPENRLILAAGPLSGTKAKGSSTISVVTLGPMTNGVAATQANGYLAAYLKFAGFDSVVFQGKAPRLTYLYVHDGKAELKDARHLAGKDTWETEELIKQELGFQPAQMSVFSIGPAGENLVRFAALVGDRGHVAAHGGVGAVMGSKNLKAIAVARGQGRVEVQDDKGLSELANKLFDITKTDPQYQQLYKWGTLHLFGGAVHAGRLPYKNYTTSVCPMNEEQIKTFDKEYLRTHYQVVRRHTCWGCSMDHCTLIKIPEGPLAGKEGEEPEFEHYTSAGSQLGVWNGLTATALGSEVDRLGMDVNETGWVLGMAMECWEKGLITAKDTGGIELKWGNLDAIRAMLHAIAHRQGFGNVLAEGSMRAAAKIGGQAPTFAIHTMSGNTPIGHDHRLNWAYMFDISVANTGSTELHLGPRPSNLGLGAYNMDAADDVAKYVSTVKWVLPFFDSIGICRLPNREYPDLLIGMLNAATGLDYTRGEIEDAGFRIINLMRVFNLRRGRTRALDRPSPRYGSVPVDGPGRGRDISPHWEGMLDLYYDGLGWDREGRPTVATLKRLGLEKEAAPN
jgi:aldehyde:ferredoxin oxidoreductase